jgi:hypothetical protein
MSKERRVQFLATPFTKASLLLPINTNFKNVYFNLFKLFFGPSPLECQNENMTDKIWTNVITKP